MSKGEGPSARELALKIWGRLRGTMVLNGVMVEHPDNKLFRINNTLFMILEEELDSFLVSHSQPLGSQQFTDGSDSKGSLPTTTASPQGKYGLTDTEIEPLARLAGNELQSWRCICGAHKRPGNALCDHCWKGLSVAERRRLRRMLKVSYVLTYNDIRKKLLVKPPAGIEVIAGKGPLSSKDGQETVEQKGSHSQPAPLPDFDMQEDVMDEAYRFLRRHDFVTDETRLFGVSDVTTCVAAAIFAERNMQKGSHRGMPAEEKK